MEWPKGKEFLAKSGAFMRILVGVWSINIYCSAVSCQCWEIFTYAMTTCFCSSGRNSTCCEVPLPPWFPSHTWWLVNLFSTGCSASVLQLIWVKNRFWLLQSLLLRQSFSFLIVPTKRFPEVPKKTVIMLRNKDCLAVRIFIALIFFLSKTIKNEHKFVLFRFFSLFF